MSKEPTAEALEAGRVLFAGACTFIAGAPHLDAIPESALNEVAFVGRSNAGKSSLINALVSQHRLARVSNTPGRTRDINFFSLGDRLMLADLPGYGFAKVSKSESQRWNDLIFAYLRGRTNLRRVVLLIDARRGVMENDDEVMKLLDRAAMSYQIVLTKADKLKPAEIADVLAATASRAAKHGAAHPDLIVTSSVSGAGLPELRAELASLAA